MSSLRNAFDKGLAVPRLPLRAASICAVGSGAPQVLVETLDRHFKNVCELDIIFNSDKVHMAIDEMIVGGLVVETNTQELVEAIEGQLKLEYNESELGSAAAAAQSRLDRLASTLNSLPRPGFDVAP